MINAPLTAYQAALRARMITSACTIAHHRATEAVKQALRERGLRPQQYSHRGLGLLATEYAKRHGDYLINDATTTVERWRTEGFFGKRAMAMGNAPLLAPPTAQSVRNLPQLRTLPTSEAHRQGEIQR
jgi:hypothetical protein